MNVFKLLSRSSKLSQTIPSHKLPSSGAVANPQLFGHDESPTSQHNAENRRKRKRGESTTKSTIALPASIDFFGEAAADDDGNRTAVVRSSHELTTDGDRQIHEGAFDELEDDMDSAEAGYDEEESKRILRTHKLKVVVVEDFAPQRPELEKDTKVKRSRKKRKSEADEINKSKKGAKRQLFPQPLTSFTQLRSRYSVSRRLAENVQEQGYKLPTEVQLGALPILLQKDTTRSGTIADFQSGKDAAGDESTVEIDLLTVAPTGSGKTVAFLIPMINSLLSKAETDIDLSRGPRAIILAPTKELASQIVNEARKLAKGTRVKAVLMKKGVEVVERSEVESSSVHQGPFDAPRNEDHSGSGSENDSASERLPKRKQRRAELVKAAILVATPLALLNALKNQDGSTSELANVRSLVLDEADVLLDPLFREQTLSVWNACTNTLLRVGLWSATMGSNIESLVLETLNSRWQTISPPASSIRAPLIRLVVGLKDSAIPNVAHRLIYGATEQGKLLGLRQLLHPTATPSTANEAPLRPPFLVFTQTIARAIALHSELLYDIPPEAGGSSRIAVLHADLSSTARDSVMTRFRRGEVWVLITTDLLSRGVDFRGLNGVVNYDVPNSAAAYIHRVGRTGRAGREGGVAVTFYTQEDIPYVKNVANVIRASEKLKGKGEDDATIKQWLLDALPTPSKRDKQQLKKRGIEARRTVKDADGRSKMRISTKSGYERQKENDLKGAKMANSRRDRQAPGQIEDSSESEFEGFGA